MWLPLWLRKLCAVVRVCPTCATDPVGALLAPGPRGLSWCPQCKTFWD